jgi:hypothetical protein
MSLRQIAKCRLNNEPDANSELCGSCEHKFQCFTTGKLRKAQSGKFRYAFDVPNNEEGQKFLELCKKFLNKELWGLKPRGRHSERSVVYGYSRRDVLLKDAEWFAVYLNRKGRSDYESS